MPLRAWTRSALVLLPLLVLAGRLHAQRTASPQGMTQELNRCLTIVRVAASRRREASGRETILRGAASRRGDSAAPVATPVGLAKTA